MKNEFLYQGYMWNPHPANAALFRDKLRDNVEEKNFLLTKRLPGPAQPYFLAVRPV